MVYLIYIFIILSFALIIGSLFHEQERVSIIKTKKQLSPKDALFILVKPLNAINIPLLKIFPMIEKKLSENIDFVRWNITPADFFSIKEIVGIILAAVIFIGTPFDLMWVFFAGIVGFLLPDFILSSKVKNRKYAIVRILPETVDLLSLCVSAGLDFMASVRWLTMKAKMNPMLEELKSLLEEVKIGRSKVEALRGMAKRLNIPEVTSFVRSLIQAERMGTPVEETFKIISDDVRTRRSYQGRREAMKTSLKMLIPLIVFILPIILIIVGGPVLLNFMRGGIGQLVK